MAHFTIENPQYKKHIADFLVMIDAKNLSGGQARAYKSALLEFLSWLEANQIESVQDILPRHVNLYAGYLETRPNMRREGGLSQSSILGTHFLAIRTFFEFLLETGALDAIVLLPKKLRAKYQPRQIATEEEIKKIYAVCETYRDRSILSCAYGAGLRRTEIHWLDMYDVQLSKARLSVREGKGRKTRSVVLCEAVIQDFKTYINTERTRYVENGKIPTHAFMVNDRGKRMTGDHMNKRLKALIEKTEREELIKKDLTLHSLRASISTHLVDRGADIDFVQSFLGHSNIDSSHIYIQRRKQKLLIQSQK